MLPVALALASAALFGAMTVLVSLLIMIAALAVAALPVSAEGQSGGTTSAQTPSRPFSELVGAGYEVKGFAMLPPIAAHRPRRSSLPAFCNPERTGE